MFSAAALSRNRVDQLLKVLLVVSRTVERVLESDAVAEAVAEPLSASQAQVLRLLGHHERQSVSQIAGFLGVTRAAVSQLIDSMVDARLVRRRPAEHDRRGVTITLTSQGRSRFRAMCRAQHHRIRSAARFCTPDDLRRWIDTTLEIASALARADRTFKRFCFQCGAHLDGTCVLVGGDAKCPFLQHHSKGQRPFQGQPRRAQVGPSRVRRTAGPTSASPSARRRSARQTQAER